MRVRDVDAVIVAFDVVLVGVVVPQREGPPQVVQLFSQLLAPLGPLGLRILAFAAPVVPIARGSQRLRIARFFRGTDRLAVGAEIGFGGLPSRADAGDIAAYVRDLLSRR